MVFVTASPVLTNEVKQYYASLKEQLHSHLVKVEKVNRQKIEESETSNAEEIFKAPDDQELERQKLLNVLELKEQEIMQS